MIKNQVKPKPTTRPLRTYRTWWSNILCAKTVETTMKKIYPLLLLFSIAFCQTFGQFRKYSNEFLNIGAGARGLAMGSAQVASVKDGTSGYWNPAGLVNVKDHPQVNIMHAEYFAGIGKYDYASLALPLKDNKRTLGLSLLRFAVDDIPNTIFLVEPDGTINFDNITSFSSADYAFLVSLAQQVNLKKNKTLNAGLNANYRLADRWSLVSSVNYKRLLGGAADSPIVRLAGSPNQMNYSAFVVYSF